MGVDQGLKIRKTRLPVIPSCPYPINARAQPRWMLDWTVAQDADVASGIELTLTLDFRATLLRIPNREKKGLNQPGIG